jgi:hypothetical protein
MATRIFRFTCKLDPGQSNDGQGTDPTQFVINVPSQDVQRTIVEIRPFGADAFEYTGYYDTDLYHDIDSNDINTYHRPHFVGLTLTGTHYYVAQMVNKGTTSGALYGVDIVVEETAISGTAPTGGAATA